jgi:hypothetical protein
VPDDAGSGPGVQRGSALRAALRYLASLIDRSGDDTHLFELSVIIVLIVLVTTLSLVFLADPIADLVTLIGGRADPGAAVN